jgi:hypothetical protein
VDTRGLVVRAAPGEVNRMSIRSSPRGVVIDDLGAALTGACRSASSGGRFCRGQFDGVEVELGDGSDRIDFRDLGGSVDGGPGDDEIVVAARLTCLPVAPAPTSSMPAWLPAARSRAPATPRASRSA